MPLRIASCRVLPEPDIDAAPLADALARAGLAFDVLAWDDAAIEWDRLGPTLIRSTWNYARQLSAFERWIDRVSAAGPLLNPRAVVLDNLHKRYLLALSARGVPIVDTELVERGCSLDLSTRTRRFVIKPEVGAASLGTEVFEPGDPAAELHLAALAATGAALVQPYFDSVDDYGERSLVWIDGALSHAIRKHPRLSGEDEAVTGPFPIADDERAVALAAMAPHRDLLYARIDLVRDADGRPRVMELELIEPSLFFSYAPGSADRFVAGLARRLA